MLTLTDIVARGQAAYEATLPDYFKRKVEPCLNSGKVSQVERADIQPSANLQKVNLTLSEDRQIAICLSCPLPDCVGLESRHCPIRREQSAVWREKNRRKIS